MVQGACVYYVAPPSTRERKLLSQREKEQLRLPLYEKESLQGDSHISLCKAKVEWKKVASNGSQIGYMMNFSLRKTSVFQGFSLSLISRLLSHVGGEAGRQLFDNGREPRECSGKLTLTRRGPITMFNGAQWEHSHQGMGVCSRSDHVGVGWNSNHAGCDDPK